MSLLATRMLELRVSNPDLSKWTLRPSNYGALDCFMSQTESQMGIITPQLEAQAARAVGRDVKIPVWDEETVSIGSTRSVTITDDENDSALYTVAFTTYAWGFTVTPAQHSNNEFSMQQDFNRKFMKYMIQFLKDLDTAALSTLDTNKSQVFADLLGYTNTANVISATLAQRNEVLGALTPMMQANDFFGGYDLVGNMGVSHLVNQLAEQDVFNDKNKTIQYLDKNLKYTNRLANIAGKSATGYVINQGSMGMLFRQEADALLGTRLENGTSWGIEVLPGVNIPVSTYYYPAAADVSSFGAHAAHLTRAAKHHYGFSVDVGFLVSHNSDLTTYASPITKFNIANS